MKIITVNSKEDDDMFVDKIIEDNDNIGKVLAISKESLGTEVKEKADIIEDEGETNVDIEEDSKNTSQGKIMTSLEETAKVKELLKISVDTKEVENTIDKIDLANVNESTNTWVKDEGMIITDEVSSTDSKGEIKTDNEGDSNISIKSRTKNIINQEDTSAIVENEKFSKTSTKKYFGAASNQTTHMLSLLLDSIVIPQLRYNKVNTDECDVNLNDGKKDIEVVKISTMEIDAASEKYLESNVEDENIIDMEDISMCETNEEAIKEIITVNSKEDDDIFVDKIIEDNDNIGEVLAISKEPLGTEVKEKADIIEAEGETKVDIKEDSKNSSQGKIMTSLEETAKVKELLKISVDTKEVENIIDKIELANVNEST